MQHSSAGPNCSVTCSYEIASGECAWLNQSTQPQPPGGFADPADAGQPAARLCACTGKGNCAKTKAWQTAHPLRPVGAELPVRCGAGQGSARMQTLGKAASGALDVRCWMLDVGCSAALAVGNIQHPTSNIEHPMCPKAGLPNACRTKALGNRTSLCH